MNFVLKLNPNKVSGMAKNKTTNTMLNQRYSYVMLPIIFDRTTGHRMQGITKNNKMLVRLKKKWQRAI